MTTVYYYGCIGSAGHYLHDPRTRRAVYDVRHPWDEVGEPHIDGGLAPAKRRRHHQDVEAPPGHAALHYKRGWTALAFWDRTVDERGASTSVFIAQGFFGYEEFVTLARGAWPKLWERFERGGDPETNEQRSGLVKRKRELSPFTVQHVQTVSDAWGINFALAKGAASAKLLEQDWSPDDLREMGWTVAVHNDYRLNGEARTFWLVTKDGEAIKGEGFTDSQALNEIRRQLEARKTPLASEIVRNEVLRFATAIQHGDERHQAWLMEAATAFVNGQPLPPPTPPQPITPGGVFIDDGLTDG